MLWLCHQGRTLRPVGLGHTLLDQEQPQLLLGELPRGGGLIKRIRCGGRRMSHLIILTVVVVLTRATPRRLAGASVGAAVMGGAGLGIIAIGESAGWWHFVMTWEPYFLTLMWIGMIPCGFLFLITWRIARRFGGRGLAVVICVVAVVGPLRDSWYMARFPEWGTYGPGFAPMVATSGAYILLGIIGHGVMRLVAGPAAADPLARHVWRPA